MITEGSHWSKVQQYAQKTVVQVLAQVGKFNWQEPYSIEEQFENRGTGFFVSKEGEIITNAHVVDEAKHLSIQMPLFGQQLIGAEVVGMCPQRDIALLRVKPEYMQMIGNYIHELPLLAFGDSDRVHRTDSVLVIGYPLGQSRLKSSTGVVSGYDIVNGRALIQITAPVNPGNSGGPLLDTSGHVIGVAFAAEPMAQNIGYAIPINELKLIMESLKEGGLVRKPHFGVEFAYGSQEHARYFGNPEPSGLYISKVIEGSLCHRAGVQSGDMLYECNGYPIDAYGETVVSWSSDKMTLPDLLARLKVGELVTLVLYRAGKRIEVEFVFEIAQLPAVRIIYPNFEFVSYEIIAGLVIMELAHNHLQVFDELSYDLTPYRRPENCAHPVLIISHVIPGSHGYDARTLVPGDLIKEINGRTVNTLADFALALHQSVETGFFTLKTKQDVLAVFDIRQVLDNEERLSNDFSFPISSLVLKIKRDIAQHDGKIK